jgi:hypothetical protein
VPGGTIQRAGCSVKRAITQSVSTLPGKEKDSPAHRHEHHLQKQEKRLARVTDADRELVSHLLTGALA